jgi:hypothetical protein
VGSLLKPLLKKLTPLVGSRMVCMVYNLKLPWTYNNVFLLIYSYLAYNYVILIIKMNNIKMNNNGW